MCAGPVATIINTVIRNTVYKGRNVGLLYSMNKNTVYK